jgi:hypothetical protein
MTCILFLAVSVLAIVPAEAETYGRTGFHIDWWNSDSGEDGFQYHIPIEAGLDYRNFYFKVLTAYAYNEIDPDNESSRSFDGFVDTKVNLAYESVAKLPVDLLFALDFNLPTGKTGLDARDTISIADPDKATITRMGEGFNVNPNISVLKHWGALYTAVGVGYIWRGSFDAADTMEDYDPGNALNLTGAVDYIFNSQWTGRLFGSWTRFETDELAGVDYYEPGDVTIVGAGVTYARATWELGGVVKAIFRDKDERQNNLGVLQPEPENYFGDEWIAEINGRVQITDRMDVKAWIQYLMIDENDYPTTDPYYLSEREKTLFGCELVGRLTARWEAGLRLQGYFMEVDNNPSNSAAGSDFDGGSATLWVSARF